jgi:hypothetical protein
MRAEALRGRSLAACMAIRQFVLHGLPTTTDAHVLGGAVVDRAALADEDRRR